MTRTKMLDILIIVCSIISFFFIDINKEVLKGAISGFVLAYFLAKGFRQ